MQAVPVNCYQATCSVQAICRLQSAGSRVLVPARDWAADVRDWAADVRDWAADVRDWAADVRDWAADVRDWAADVRDWDCAADE